MIVKTQNEIRFLGFEKRVGKKGREFLSLRFLSKEERGIQYIQTIGEIDLLPKVELLEEMELVALDFSQYTDKTFSTHSFLVGIERA